MPDALRYAAYYPDTGGYVLRVKISQSKFDLIVNGTANGSYDQPTDTFQTVSSGTSHRSPQLKPRYVTFRFEGTPPSGYKAGVVLKSVIMSKGLWDRATPNSIGTYRDSGIRFLERYPESN